MAPTHSRGHEQKLKLFRGRTKEQQPSITEHRSLTDTRYCVVVLSSLSLISMVDSLSPSSLSMLFIAQRFATLNMCSDDIWRWAIIRQVASRSEAERMAIVPACVFILRSEEILFLCCSTSEKQRTEKCKF